MKRSFIGGRPPPSHVLTGASLLAPVLEPIRIRDGRGGSVVPTSPIRTSSRCSM